MTANDYFFNLCSRSSKFLADIPVISPCWLPATRSSSCLFNPLVLKQQTNKQINWVKQPVTPKHWTVMFCHGLRLVFQLLLTIIKHSCECLIHYVIIWSQTQPSSYILNLTNSWISHTIRTDTQGCGVCLAHAKHYPCI